MMGGRTGNRNSISAASIIGACRLCFGILLSLAMAACGALAQPDTPAPETPSSQRYWHDVNNTVVLHWDASTHAEFYTIYFCLPSKGCPLHRPQLGETRSTAAAVYIGEHVYRDDCSRENPCHVTQDGENNRSTNAADFILELYVAACNFSGCSESEAAQPALPLLVPDGPAPSSPTGFRGEKVLGPRDLFGSETATTDASVEWDPVEEATYYELWVGSVASSDFRLGLQIPRFGGPGYTFVAGDNRVSPIDTPVNRGSRGEYKTTSWKVRACTKAGCSPFSDTVTIN